MAERVPAVDPAGAQDPLSGADVGQRVMRGGVQRASGFIAANLLTALGAILLLRYLGVREFGRFGTVMALIAIVQGISDAGLSMTATRELAVLDDEAERRDVLAHILGLRIVLTAGGIVAAVAFAIVAGYERTLVAGTLVAGVGILLQSVQAAMLLPLTVEMRNGAIALNEVLRQLALVATWGVLAIAGAALLPFFGAQIVAGVVMLLAVPVLLARRGMVAPRWSGERLRALAGVAVPVAIATVLGVVYLRMLVVLMSLVSGSERQIGYYVTSTRIVEIFISLPFLLTTVILPVLTVAARDDRDRLGYITARTTEVMALGGVTVVLLLTTAAHPIVVILGGHQYAPAAPVLQIQALSLVALFIAAGWNQTLLGLGRVRTLAYCSAIGVVGLLVGGLVLIPALGAKGAAIAAVCADVTLALATYVGMRRAGQGHHVPLGSLGRIALAALPAALVGFIPGLPAIVAAVVAVAVFAACAVVLRAVPSELLALVGAARRRAQRA